jgi:hypothetical protein
LWTRPPSWNKGKYRKWVRENANFSLFMNISFQLGGDTGWEKVQLQLL